MRACVRAGVCGWVGGEEWGGGGGNITMDVCVRAFARVCVCARIWLSVNLSLMPVIIIHQDFLQLLKLLIYEINT